MRVPKRILKYLLANIAMSEPLALLTLSLLVSKLQRQEWQ